MQRKLIRYLIAFGAGFVALFVVRLMIGFTDVPAGGPPGFVDNLTLGNGNSGFFENSRKNYFSGKYDFKDVPKEQHGAAGPGGRDQKYEKVARLGATSTDFSTHEKALRTSIQAHNAIVQAEESSGLVGRRFLHLSIGVPPDKFDAMLDEVRAIGALSSIQVNKTDKTNEYKDLNAHRVSLEKARDAMVALKSRSAAASGNAIKIDELINLENKILEIEESIQKLGVRLGEFDGENEFVTIQCSLTETGVAKPLSLLHRVKVAFEWTVKWYLALVGLGLLATLAALALLVLVERLRALLDPARRPDDKS